MNIWNFQTRLICRLLIWSIFSMVASVPMFVSTNPFWRGVAIQSLAWGAIDAAIAVFGMRISAKKKVVVEESERAAIEVKKARWLERVL